MATVTFTAGPPTPKWVTGELATTTGPQQPGDRMIQSVLSKAYIQVPVQAISAGTIYNPTADVVQFAFTTVGTDPVTGDWKTGSWTTDLTTGNYLAQCLIGPGGTITLARGTYAVWIKITDSPEVPVEELGTLQIV